MIQRYMTSTALGRDTRVSVNQAANPIPADAPHPVGSRMSRPVPVQFVVSVPTQIRATISCGLLIRPHNLTYPALTGQRIFYLDCRKISERRVIHSTGFGLLAIPFRAPCG